MRANHLSFENAKQILWPEKDPLLGPGYVSNEYKLTEDNISAEDNKKKIDAALKSAKSLFNDRRKLCPWENLHSVDSAYTPRPHADQFIDALNRLKPASDKRDDVGTPTTQGSDAPPTHQLAQAQRVEAIETPSPPPSANPTELLDALIDRILEDRENGNIVFIKRLPFYENGWLMHIEPHEGGINYAKRIAFAVSTESQNAHGFLDAAILNGKSKEIRELNQKSNIQARLSLDACTVAEYVVFFCEHVHGQLGGFHVIEEDLYLENSYELPNSLHLRATDIREKTEHVKKYDKSNGRRTGNFVYEKADIPWPITFLERKNPEDPWICLTTVVYGSGAYRVAFKVCVNGKIEMLADAHIRNAIIVGPELFWRPAANEAGE